MTSTPYKPNFPQDPDGIQGWTISVYRNDDDQPLLGSHHVWWVIEHGPDVAREKAYQHLAFLKNFDNERLNKDVSHYVALPIIVAAVPKTAPAFDDANYENCRFCNIKTHIHEAACVHCGVTKKWAQSDVSVEEVSTQAEEATDTKIKKPRRSKTKISEAGMKVLLAFDGRPTDRFTIEYLRHNDIQIRVPIRNVVLYRVIDKLVKDGFLDSRVSHSGEMFYRTEAAMQALGRDNGDDA